MHEYPFTLVRADVLNEEGKSVFKRPLWLIVTGKRREEVSLVECHEAYGQRVDLEQYFRFGKRKLMSKGAFKRLRGGNKHDIEFEVYLWRKITNPEGETQNQCCVC